MAEDRLERKRTEREATETLAEAEESPTHRIPAEQMQMLAVPTSENLVTEIMQCSVLVIDALAGSPRV